MVVKWIIQLVGSQGRYTGMSPKLTQEAQTLIFLP